MKDFDILRFGAAADGVADDAAAIQRAIDAAAAAGGGRVVVPAGRTVRAGHFELRSRIDLHVALGARLVSATGIEAFPRHVFTEGPEIEKRLWIGCRHAEDVALSGPGTIDGQCRAFALGETEHIVTPTVRWRPATTCFEDCHRVSVRDLRFVDAANWTLHFAGCTDVEVRDVTIANDPKFPNADGIDPDHCRRVRISGCHIVSGDDCIAIKNTASYARYGPCEDIEIAGCRLRSGSAAVKIGSESVDAFRRIRVSDCAIEASNRGLAIQVRDSGAVEDVEYRGIEVETRRFSPVWWGAGEAIYVTALPRHGGAGAASIRGVRFHDIRCRGENGVVIYGEPEGAIEELTFDRVRLDLARHTPWPSGLFDLRPCAVDFAPARAQPVGEPSHQGRPFRRAPAVFSVEGAQGVRLRGVAYTPPPCDSEPWAPLWAAVPIDGHPRLALGGQVG
jgi:hypothetical protein